MRKLLFLNCLKIAALCVSCASQGDVAPDLSSDNLYNVIFIIADDASRDDFGFYEKQNVKTPNLDSLAAKSLVFNNAYLTTSSCSPSRISIITGRYPHNTGAAELETYPNMRFSSIASELKSKGYQTLQAGKWHMGPLERRNFDLVDEQNLQQGGEERWLDLFEKLDQRSPFFMWLSSKDPHRELKPEEFEGINNRESILLPEYLCDSEVLREEYGKYLDEISRFDYYVGKVVQKVNDLNLQEKTVIIVCSDNGRPFNRAKTCLYDDGIKTPLLIYWPKMKSMSLRTDALVSSIDIAPTILDGLGLKIPPSFQGYSFYELLEGSSIEHRNFVFAEYNWHAYRGFRRMVRNKDFLLIKNFTRNSYIGSSDVRKSLSYESGLQMGCIDERNMSEYGNELYAVPRDYYQLNSLSGHPAYQDVQSKLSETLDLWMSETKDRYVEYLTPDWYDWRGKRSESYGERGVMPGTIDNAHLSNQKGPK